MKKISLQVEPGICGFSCKIEASQINKHLAKIDISESGCKQIQGLSSYINELTTQDLFTPHTKNQVFKAVEKAGCHLSCPVPIAIVKACEVALDLALPKDVTIKFTNNT